MQSDTPEPASDDETQQPDAEVSTLPVAVDFLRWRAGEDLTIGCSAEEALKWLCPTLPYDPVLNSVRKRYFMHVKDVDHMLAVFPLHEDVANKIMIPLHQAKIAFAIGHELSCIAMCGMVGEMTAVLRFEMSANTFDTATQEGLLGYTFDTLPHERRIRVLRTLNMLDMETAGQFTNLAKIRNRYLHSFTRPHEEVWKDAKQAYGLAVAVVSKVLQLGKDAKGNFSMSQEFANYIIERNTSAPGEPKS